MGLTYLFVFKLYYSRPSEDHYLSSAGTSTNYGLGGPSFEFQQAQDIFFSLLQNGLDLLWGPPNLLVNG